MFEALPGQSDPERQTQRVGDCPICEALAEAENRGTVRRYRFYAEGSFLCEPGKQLDTLGDVIGELHGGPISMRAWEEEADA